MKKHTTIIFILIFAFISCNEEKQSALKLKSHTKKEMKSLRYSKENSRFDFHFIDNQISLSFDGNRTYEQNISELTKVLSLTFRHFESDSIKRIVLNRMRHFGDLTYEISSIPEIRKNIEDTMKMVKTYPTNRTSCFMNHKSINIFNENKKKSKRFNELIKLFNKNINDVKSIAIDKSIIVDIDILRKNSILTIEDDKTKYFVDCIHFVIYFK